MAPDTRPHSIDPRYHRQALLPGIGVQGQRDLARAHAVVVGVGALGCVSADLLARAGAGRITLIDRDIVEISNLQRQSLYTEQDLGKPKAQAARARLLDANPTIRVEDRIDDLTPRNALKLLGLDDQHSRPDVILDGTDSFLTRLLINDAAVMHRVPWIYTGAIASRAMVAPIRPRLTACLRCLLDAPPSPGSTETCDTAGVLASASTLAASIQVAEAIKLLTNNHHALSSDLVEIDLWSNRRTSIDLRAARRDDCPCCAQSRYTYLNTRAEPGAVALCGRNTMQVSPPTAGAGSDEQPSELDLAALAVRLEPVARIQLTPYLLRAAIRRTPPTPSDASGLDGNDSPDASAARARTPGETIELTIFPDGRALIRGVTTPTEARALYNRYIGT